MMRRRNAPCTSSEGPHPINAPLKIQETPWDARALGTNTYEITSLSEDVLKKIGSMAGHFTVRVDPLCSTKLLHEYGFYYCDTLIEPYCSLDKFTAFADPSVSVSRNVAEKELQAMAHGAFAHGRFHRDFQVDNDLADLRYDLWLQDLFNAGSVLGLMYHYELAGFFGLNENRIVLNAVGEKHQGQGLAKYLWSAACANLFQSGYGEITSSISAANVAILNVYSALGFGFRNPLDMYHRFNK